jgi:hypothetical protein
MVGGKPEAQARVKLKLRSVEMVLVPVTLGVKAAI